MLLHGWVTHLLEFPSHRTFFHMQSSSIQNHLSSSTSLDLPHTSPLMDWSPLHVKLTLVDFSAEFSLTTVQLSPSRALSRMEHHTYFLLWASQPFCPGSPYQPDFPLGKFIELTYIWWVHSDRSFTESLSHGSKILDRMPYSDVHR